jgi:hypothetical protein
MRFSDLQIYAFLPLSQTDKTQKKR